MINKKLGFKYVLFDLDGTLTDSAEGIIKSVQYSAEKMGIEIPEFEALKVFVGPPLRDIYSEYFGFDGEDLDKAVEYYRERYASKGINENSVYNGIPEVLEYLKAKGITLAVATSKPEKYAELIIKDFGLDKYFDYVFGSTFDEERNTKTKVIEYALRIGNIAKADTIMIGDRNYDVIGAKETGIQCIGVTYGYGDTEELTSAGADYIVHSVSEIKKLF